MTSIDIIFFIQNKDIEKIQKMIAGVLLQNTSAQIKWIIYGNVSDSIKKMFAGKYEKIFISTGKSLQEDYRKIISELMGDYFTIITDNEEWTDTSYVEVAIDVLSRKPEFSIYGANSYNVCLDENEFDLRSIHCDGLFDNYYREYVNYGIDDFFYHLALDRKTQVLIVPHAMLFTNIRSVYEVLFYMPEMVLETLSLKTLLYFLNLKHGMSLLKNNVVEKIDSEGMLKWKRYIQYAMQVYALKYIYTGKNPRWIYEYVNLEYYNGIKNLRHELQRGYVLSNIEMQQINFLNKVSEELPKGSPMLIKSYGNKNPDKIFLVLELERRAVGLWAVTFQVLGAIKYARENGMIPIIDFKNHFLRIFQSTNKRYKENAWEYYFQQPEPGLTLEEVYESKNVIHCDEFGWCNPVWYDLLPANAEVVNKWNQIIQKELHLKQQNLEYVEEIYQRSMASKSAILGVSLRAEFVREKLGGGELVLEHPIQLELYETINMIKKYMEMWKCSWLFLVVDDKFWFDEIKREFGEKCLYVNRIRQQYFNKANEITDTIQRVRKVYEYGLEQNNIEYICETYLLARCNSLLAGNCGCSRMAYFLNNNQYEHVEIIDKGKY